MARCILGDPGADSGDEGKSKWVEKCGTKKSKERREEPLGTMSYQTSSKRSPPFWLLIGARKTQVFWHQSEARTGVTVWNWSGQRGCLLTLVLKLFLLYYLWFSKHNNCSRQSDPLIPIAGVVYFILF